MDEESFPGKLLHQAALWDNADLLVDLLNGDQLHFINCQDDFGRASLHAAVLSKNSKCLPILLQFEANVNIQCNSRAKKNTPIHICAENGYQSNLELLLNHGADPTLKNSDGFTAADIAEKSGHFTCAKILRKFAHAKEHYRFEQYSKLSEICKNDSFQNFQTHLNSIENDSELIINLAPNGANTLLFTACEVGKIEIVDLLIRNGADGRSHPVTQYSPLYIACYHGHMEIVERILAVFPQLINQSTVEKWLPIHAACMKGHTQLVRKLLYFQYPKTVLSTFKCPQTNKSYLAAFDINHLDVNGQSVLYIASILGNEQIIEMLLNYKLPALSSNLVENDHSSGNKDGEQTDINEFLTPVAIDQYCNHFTETALHASVKAKHYNIALLLLKSLANVNLPIKTNTKSGESSSCLIEASLNRDAAMLDLLLQFGALDNDCKSLRIAIENQDDLFTSRLLATKAYCDPDFKINKKQMTNDIHSNAYFSKSNVANQSLVTYSSIFPNNPVILNWHNLKCNLTQLKKHWLLDAIIALNPKLKRNLRSEEIALFAITRIDLSSNNLISVPIVIFQLGSLRSLNLSQNKIDKLPIVGFQKSKISIEKKYKRSQSVESRRLLFRCPVLEELFLQDNNLEFVPEAVFELPSLITLNLANNKLQSLPYSLWNAPKLRELNVSFNLLKDLPFLQKEVHKELKNSCSEGSLASYLKPIVCSISDDKICSHNSHNPNMYLRDQLFRSQVLKKNHHWTKNVEVTDQILHLNDEINQAEKTSQIISLNLSHNMFNEIPSMIACLTPRLSKLNMSHNLITNMSFITSYPSSLKQLDLSYNEIADWPSLPQLNSSDTVTKSHLLCYCELQAEKKFPHLVSDDESVTYQNQLLKSVCQHRRHLKLDSLKILILSHNQLLDIQLSADHKNDFSIIDSNDDLFQTTPFVQKAKLTFPNLSMLDLAHNFIKEIPKSIKDLTNLSILNVSENSEISDLPIEMGLLNHLWNLNTTGCSLQEPLKSMINSKKYKTMDIVGFLKSVLEDARPYTRMKLMIVGVQAIGKTSLLELLRQEGVTRRKFHEHWTKRVGNKNIGGKAPKNSNLSTVGVDIDDWIYERKPKSPNNHGPVFFRTWDFGGQKEYYTTHQYFLSKRSLYLVIWKLLDGHKGIEEIYQWLVNIQSRAPNSPVLIVGTHHDMINDYCSELEQYQRIIRDRFINIMDAEKHGLPKVLDSIEISCKTKYNIKYLCNLIYDTVFSLKQPGNKELMLEQRVPVTYLLLEDIVNNIVSERRTKNLDPVLTTDSYRNLILTEMNTKHNRSFRDLAELHQATMFLHENGVLLHYDDSTLKDLYFLDPQWLCDMLAHVVTIREINPFARNGIMKIEDLKIIFKSNSMNISDLKSYIINLLTKFEVALTWDSRTLLIPSLLPLESECFDEQFNCQPNAVKVPLRCLKSRTKLNLETNQNCNIVSKMSNLESLLRFYVMAYFPSGFWSRLISRVLSDESITKIIQSYFSASNQKSKLVEFKSEWILWQTGFQLVLNNNLVVFRLREINLNNTTRFKNLKFLYKRDFNWSEIDYSTNSLLEIYIPCNTVSFEDGEFNELTTNIQSATSILAFVTDHIDTLLEDWYPMLGTRFIHTSEGKFLITRLIPCKKCFYLSSHNIDHFVADKKYPNDCMSDEMSNSDKDSGVGRESELAGCASPSTGNDEIVHCWTVEECILESHKTKIFSCPNHGAADLEIIAPDLIFMDLDVRLKVNSKFVKKGILLGHGAFGFVFKASLKLPHDKTATDIAMKMLQPIHPGISARNSALIAFRAAHTKWERDPLQNACKSYCIARQELAILLNLKHSNIVSMIGICVDPLALLLELAPLGSLSNILKNFRKSSCQLHCLTLYSIMLQISKALEYLHRNHIIYRDLKSENVLVWEMPAPFQKEKLERVTVKLADYGISRLSFLNGTKGFGGTEGYMAPEIMKYKGEEEYTEKVDCFSFGMFIYEMITLRPPFEAYESFKDQILQGCRPSLTYKQVSYPCYLLDLMTICWSQFPNERPSSSQIVSLLSAPEFINLYDITELNHQLQISSIFHISNILHPDGIPRTELWILNKSEIIDILVCSTKGWKKYANFDAKIKATKGCVLDNHILIADQFSQLHLFELKSCEKIFQFKLKSSSETTLNFVVDLFYSKNYELVICGLSSGQIYLLNSSILEQNQVHILSELELKSTLSSFCFIPINESNKSFEIWCNESNSEIGIFSFKNNIMVDKDSIYHNKAISENNEVIYLKSSKQKLWSFIKPGYILHQWDAMKRKILSKLDCSKLIPCSETLKSIAIEENLSHAKFQITSLASVNREVYIGTAWGCVIIAECNTLRPIKVFRPYEFNTMAIHPVFLRNDNNEDDYSSVPMIVTFGKSYRNLLARYFDLNQNFETNITSALLWTTDNRIS